MIEVLKSELKEKKEEKEVKIEIIENYSFENIQSEKIEN